MGYCTAYSLTVRPIDSSGDLLQSVLGEPEPDWEVAISQHGSLGEDGNYNPFEEACKWYDHEKDMKSLSNSIPGHVFILHGQGEESEDIWKKTFFRGRMHVAKAEISFESPPDSFFS
jgi:hypothetical protein